MSRKFWTQTTRPSEIKRLNKKLIIPAFSANCGKSSSLVFGGVVGAANDAILAGKNEFTVECWFKPEGPSSFFVYKGVVNEAWRLQWIDLGGGVNYLFAVFTNSAGTTYTIYSDILPTEYQWSHIAWTYSKAGLISKLYLNGRRCGSVVIANFGLRVHDGTGMTIQLSLAASVDDLRFWNVARTEEQINYNRYAPRGVVDSANGLIAYWNFNEGAGNIATDLMAGLIITPLANNILQWSTESPMKYGASFIAAKASVANLTSSENVSLKFPLIPPSNVNFALAISWTDFNNKFQRRLLWNPDASVGNIDWAPQLVYYNGERLPPTFDFEIINIDGKATVDLASDYTIELSNTSLPNDSTDITEVSVGTLTIDKTLAQNFSLTPFPLTFNSMQTY